MAGRMEGQRGGILGRSSTVGGKEEDLVSVKMGRAVRGRLMGSVDRSGAMKLHYLVSLAISSRSETDSILSLRGCRGFGWIVLSPD